MKTITLLVLSALLFQCSLADELTGRKKKSEPGQNVRAVCEPGNLPVTTIDDYFGCPTKYFLNIDLNNTYTLIRTQAEYNSLVTYSGDCPMNLDLTNFDLLIGKKQLTSGNESISYNYATTDCVTKTLTVTFHQNETMHAPNVTYHALIPKVSSNEILQVETVID